jgi:hypothetical protein
MIFDEASISFRAACNEAVDQSMRPIRSRVIWRLARRFHSDDTDKHLPTKSIELQKLFAAISEQAKNELSASLPPWPDVEQREKIAESRFIQLIGTNPLWRMLVLDAVVQERRWSDLWKRSFQFAYDRFVSLLQKLMSPQHPVARGTTSVLAIIVTTALPILLVPRIVKNKNLYADLFDPVRRVFETKSTVSVTANSDLLLHVRTVVDDANLTAVITPIAKPVDLSMTFRPTIDASLKITPGIQYPPVSSGDSVKSAGKQQGLAVHFIPTADLPNFSKSLSDPGSVIKVSVQELAVAPVSDSKPAKLPTVPTPAPKETNSPITSVRPLDKIDEELVALNTTLSTLGSEFQASSGHPESSLAALQQGQNLIHSTAANQGRAIVIEAKPNSVHSVVLQWFEAAKDPGSCTLTFAVNDVNSDHLTLSGISQKCTTNTLLTDTLPPDISLGPGKPYTLGHWTLSVDETRRRWIFSHSATLRFSWQPASVGNTTAQVPSASPQPKSD